jgi:hypothetical protein
MKIEIEEYTDFIMQRKFVFKKSEMINELLNGERMKEVMTWKLN